MTAPRPTSFHHIGLSVPDLQQGLDFYVGVLGFKELNRAEWSGSPEIDLAIGADGSAGQFAMIELDGFCIEMFQFETPAATEPKEPRVVGHGWTHICVKVENAKAMAEELKAHGAQLNSDPINIGDGPFAYARDPFGNIIEIWQDET